MRRLCSTLCVLLAGCSLIGVRAPSPPVPSTTDCDSALPYVDLGVGIAGVLTPVVIAALPADAFDSDGEDKGPGGALRKGYAFAAIGVPAGVAGLVALGSAAYGRHQVRACRSARSESARRRAAPLVDEARIAARAGDCAHVLELELEIAAISVDAQRGDLVEDPPTARCLTTAARTQVAAAQARCRGTTDDALRTTNAHADPEVRIAALRSVPTCRVSSATPATERAAIRARALGVRAALAAVDQRCGEVTRLVDEAVALDRDFVGNVLARQVDVAACLPAAAP